ncbi:MAG TPA: hypothetical protein VF610_07740 [Segetibacter sp.]
MEWSLNGNGKAEMKKLEMFVTGCVSISFFMFSCKNSTATTGSPIYYYPKKNLYYDKEKNVFLYSLDGAKSWTVFENKNKKEPENLGEKVSITKTGDEVYKNNRAHRELYKGVLYQITNNDPQEVNEAEVVSERKVVQQKKQIAVNTGRTEKRKKGIGRFFKKIFGKKNK